MTVVFYHYLRRSQLIRASTGVI